MSQRLILRGVIVREPASADGRRPNGVLEETAARAVWDHTLDLGVMDGLRMTTQAAKEYLAVGVTTASAGGMPSAVAELLGFLSGLNQFSQRVALFPLFEEVGESLLSGERSLADFAGARVSVPRVKIIADGSIQGYTGYLSEPYYVPFKGDANYRGYPRCCVTSCSVRWKPSTSDGFQLQSIAMATPQ